jgi:hypothetical protein
VDVVRRREDITLKVTTSGVVLAAAVAVVAILWALFAGVDMASPVVSRNLGVIGF